MVRTVRQITDENERRQAAIRAIAWGFPRPITLDEVKYAFWIRDFPETGVVWFHEGPLVAGHWCIHAQPAPKSSGLTFLTPELWTIVRTVAGLLGAKRVYAPLGATRPGWARYLRTRAGFDQQDAIGPFFELEG